MLKLYTVSIRGKNYDQEVLEAKLSYEEAFMTVKKYVHSHWYVPGEIPSVEDITEDQVDKFFENKEDMGFGYDIWENNVEFRPNLLLVNDGIDYDLKLFANEDDAGKAYRQEIFNRWIGVVAEDRPVESPDLLTAEMMEQFLQEVGAGSEILEIEQHELNIQ